MKKSKWLIAIYVEHGEPYSITIVAEDIVAAANKAQDEARDRSAYDNQHEAIGIAFDGEVIV